MSEYIAVDLGATSGRVALGALSNGKIELQIIHRFSHEVKEVQGQLLWDWQYIIDQVLIGLELAVAQGSPVSLAIDSWAVDYGFIDPDGVFMPPVIAYRDPRTDGVFTETVQTIGHERIYDRTGIQFLHFNTIYQLIAAKKSSEYHKAAHFLLLPDLFNYLLTGVISTEVTNASTTQLLNARTRQWDDELIELVGLNRALFSPLHEPGTAIGPVTGHQSLAGLAVIATASHDTAAAIIGVPFGDRSKEAYISSGTWSLVGVELEQPIISKESREANITNELGAYGTVRFLKNVTGLWLLEECRRTWESEGNIFTITQLLSMAAESESFSSIFNPNDASFAHPGGMPERIRQVCKQAGVTAPETYGEFTICILRSLAHAYRDTVAQIGKVANKKIEVIHVLGGGSQIDLLNQLTADISGIPVHTGPVEATLFGNIMVQAITAGEISSVAAARAILADSFEGKVFLPR